MSYKQLVFNTCCIHNLWSHLREWRLFKIVKVLLSKNHKWNRFYYLQFSYTIQNLTQIDYVSKMIKLLELLGE